MDSYVGSLSVSVTNMMEYQFLKKSQSKIRKRHSLNLKKKKTSLVRFLHKAFYYMGTSNKSLLNWLNLFTHICQQNKCLMRQNENEVIASLWSHMVTHMSTQYLNLSKGHMEVAYHLQTNAQVWIRVEFSFDFQVALPTCAQHRASVISVWHSTEWWERTRTTTCSNVSHLGGLQR